MPCFHSITTKKLLTQTLIRSKARCLSNQLPLRISQDFVRTMASFARASFARAPSAPVNVTLPNGLTYAQPTGLFINNEFYETPKTIKVETPITGKTVVEVASASLEDVDFAVESAEKSFDSHWSTASPWERASYLLKIADKLEEKKDLIAAIESFDNGKTLKLSLGDVNLSIAYFRSCAGFADKLDGRSIQSNHSEYVNYTTREPIGVCGQIIPWNFPLLMLAWKVAPALITGNTIVLKPASATPLNALMFGQILKEINMPIGVVNILPGAGSECGDALINHAKVRKIAFTGSTEIGKDIMVKAAQSNLKKVTLELGGKSPHIVFDDVDVDKAVSTIVAGIFTGAGQVCCSGSRLFVQDTIYEKLLSELKFHLENDIKVGNPFNEKNFQGAITNKQQFDCIMNYIMLGKQSKTAKLLTGGESIGDEGYYIQPTVFYDIDSDDVLSREEIFGPVLVVSKFSTVDEVIAKANDSEYGLGAGIQTNDINKALKVAKRLKSGTVWINTYNDFDATVPFGGFKQSGIGREMGAEALENYTQVKAVRIKLV